MKIQYRLINKITLRSQTQHTAVIGMSGQGKGVLTEPFLARCKGKRVDCFGLERQEGMCYGIPCDDEGFINMGKILTNGVWKPLAYKNDIYAFFGKKLVKEPLDYPKIPKSVKIITFRESDLDNDDIVNLFGSTKPSKMLLLMIVDYFQERKKQKTINLDDILYVIGEIMKGSESNWDVRESFKGAHTGSAFTIKRNIKALRGSGIFNENFDHYDVKKIMADEDSITTISETFQDTMIERAIAVGLMLKQICEYQKMRRHKRNVYLYFRELHALYRKTSEDDEDFWGLARHYIYYILTEGRDNKLWLLADWQIAQQVPDYVRTHFNKVFSFRQSKDGALGLLQYAPIDKNTLMKVQLLEKFKGIVIINGLYEYPVHVIPPPFKKKKDGENIFDVLCKRDGSRNTKEYITEKLQNDNLFLKNNGGLNTQELTSTKSKPPRF